MNRTTITAASYAALAVAVAFLLSTVLKPSPNVWVEASPDPAAIQIDGKNAGAGALHLTSGPHTIAGTYAGFAGKSISFTVEQGKPLHIVVLLMPNSGSGDQYLRDHPAEQAKREKLGGTQFDKDSATIRKLYPITSLLPHEGANFRIDYGASKQNPDDPYALALYITVPRQGEEAPALNWLRFSGYNPSDYELVYQYEIGRD